FAFRGRRRRAMSIVAISDTVGSLGDEVGRVVARALGYEFADREIITKAAERFGESALDLWHAAEEKPKLWERFAEAQQRYRVYIEATVLELAARDNAVLVGRASPIILSRAPHTLRVRVDAPEPLRAGRLEQRESLAHDSALEYLRRTDRDRAARVRFLYGVDLGDPLLYDLVLDTERLDVEHCAALGQNALDRERSRPPAESRRTMQDESLVAQARAALRAHPTTRAMQFPITCVDCVITLEGGVEAAQVRQAAEEAVACIPRVTPVPNGGAAA